MDEYVGLVFKITCLVSTLEKKLVFGLFYFHSKEIWKKIKICYFNVEP